MSGGVRLVVRLSPRASRNGVDGIALDAAGLPVLKLRLTAPPVHGAANACLIDWLAKAVSLRKSDITLHSGAASRTKVLYLAGEAVGLSARLDQLVSEAR